MTATEAKPPLLTARELRGLSALGVDAVVGITDIVEQMHLTILRGPRPVGPVPRGRTAGITGFVYRTVRGTTRWVGKGLDTALAWLPTPAAAGPAAPGREALRSAINGAWGDHLAARGNPLAIEMVLRHEGRALTLDKASLRQRFPGATPRLLVLVHGLGMNDLQWRRNGHDHGEALARDAGFTAVYLHYNSGLHVSDNGRRLSALLEALLAAWPVPVEELVLLGHSMGGLVLRSACHAAALAGQRWPRRLRGLVCLGTPHHGATLERGGHLVDIALGVSPYAAPLARLGHSRSAGVTDLRWGNLQDADWQGRDRHTQHRDDRQPTPPPAGVPLYLVAATRSAQAPLPSRGRGDGLVPLASALGEHRNPALALAVPEAQRFVLTSAGHFDLLDSAQVATRLARWLS